MYILYEDRINWILREISKGFKISPLNIVIFFIIIILIAILYIYLSRRASQRAKEKLLNAFNKKFQRNVKKLKLSLREIELTKTLLSYISGFSNKYKLLEDEYIFQKAAKRLLEEEPEKSEGISSLRVKLGFKKQSFESVPHSTAELVDNTIIKLINKKGTKVALGELKEITPDFLALRIMDKVNPILKGKEYIAQFQYRSGIFYFKTRCLSTKDSTAFISHSENIKRTQRRNYYRKNIQIPISIYSSEDGRRYYSYTINLGGGGASIKGSPKFFHAGETISLSIDMPGKVRVDTPAKIIDISPEKDIIRVSFIEMKEADRDKIIKYIFEQ